MPIGRVPTVGFGNRQGKKCAQTTKQARLASREGARTLNLRQLCSGQSSREFPCPNNGTVAVCVPLSSQEYCERHAVLVALRPAKLLAKALQSGAKNSPGPQSPEPQGALES